VPRYARFKDDFPGGHAVAESVQHVHQVGGDFDGQIEWIRIALGQHWRPCVSRSYRSRPRLLHFLNIGPAPHIEPLLGVR
jgi:hypothetical protein